MYDVYGSVLNILHRDVLTILFLSVVPEISSVSENQFWIMDTKREMLSCQNSTVVKSLFLLNTPCSCPRSLSISCQNVILGVHVLSETFSASPFSRIQTSCSVSVLKVLRYAYFLSNWFLTTASFSVSEFTSGLCVIWKITNGIFFRSLLDYFLKCLMWFSLVLHITKSHFQY